MSSLLQTVLSLTGLDLGAAVTRRARGFGALMIAVLFVLTAYITGVVALALYLAERMSPWAALFVIAAGFAAAAGVTLGISAMMARESEREAEELAQARQQSALTALIGQASSGGGASKTLLLAALAGLVAGGVLGGGKKD